MVRNTGLSGLGCGCALDTGNSTGTSTVESGAATMKMISSTRITSMKGVTLISEISAISPSCGSLRLRAITPLLGGTQCGAEKESALPSRWESVGIRDAVLPLLEIARHVPQHGSRSIRK